MLSYLELGIGDANDIREVVAKQRSAFCIPIRQPLALISQVQRSGGTLLAQLLDGHSQLYVHPNELHIGRPTKYSWPVIDGTKSAAAIFDNLTERAMAHYSQFGYQKQSEAEGQFDAEYRKRILPFLFDLKLQKQLFVECAQAWDAKTPRDFLDCYVTSYFNAWLDYQGLYRDSKDVKYWVTFAARLMTQPGNFTKICHDYPDGRFVAVLREPVSWFGSARRHHHQYGDPAAAAELWAASYRTILKIARGTRKKQLLLMRFEDCVLKTPKAMECVAAFLGIRFEKTMLTPTFNGMKIQSDSSYGAKVGIDKSAIDRTRDVDDECQQYIRATVGDLYEELQSVARTI